MPACISFGGLFPCISSKKRTTSNKPKEQDYQSDSDSENAQTSSKRKAVTFKKDASVMANDKDAQDCLLCEAESKDVLFRLRGDIGVVIGTSNSQSPAGDSNDEGEEILQSKQPHSLNATRDLRTSPPHPSMFEPRSSPHTIFSGQGNSPNSSSTSMFAPGGPCDSPVLSPNSTLRSQRADDINCGSIDWYKDPDKAGGAHALPDPSPKVLLNGGAASRPPPPQQHDSSSSSHGRSSEKASSSLQSAEPSKASIRSPQPASSSITPAPPKPAQPTAQLPPQRPAADARFASAPQPPAAATHSSPAIPTAAPSPGPISSLAAAAGKAQQLPAQPQGSQARRAAGDAAAGDTSVQSWLQLDPAAAAAAAGPRAGADPARQVLVRDGDDRCKEGTAVVVADKWLQAPLLERFAGAVGVLTRRGQGGLTWLVRFPGVAADQPMATGMHGQYALAYAPAPASPPAPPHPAGGRGAVNDENLSSNISPPPRSAGAAGAGGLPPLPPRAAGKTLSPAAAAAAAGLAGPPDPASPPAAAAVADPPAAGAAGASPGEWTVSPVEARPALSPPDWAVTAAGGKGPLLLSARPDRPASARNRALMGAPPLSARGDRSARMVSGRRMAAARLSGRLSGRRGGLEATPRDFSIRDQMTPDSPRETWRTGRLFKYPEWEEYELFDSDDLWSEHAYLLYGEAPGPAVPPPVFVWIGQFFEECEGGGPEVLRHFTERAARSFGRHTGWKVGELVTVPELEEEEDFWEYFVLG